MKIYFSMEDIKQNIGKTILLFAALILAVVGLVYVFNQNPHRQLQQDVFTSAAKIRNYYRDRPGYWQLSTSTAKEDNLLSESLLQYKEYDVQVGQGTDGETGLPSDKSFNIVLKHLNKSACINLSELPIDNDAKLILQSLTVINNNDSVTYSWGGENPLPIVRYSMRNICDTSENIIVWTFH